MDIDWQVFLQGVWVSVQHDPAQFILVFLIGLVLGKIL